MTDKKQLADEHRQIIVKYDNCMASPDQVNFAAERLRRAGVEVHDPFVPVVLSVDE